jgi:hypothetical protein
VLLITYYVPLFLMQYSAGTNTLQYSAAHVVAVAMGTLNIFLFCFFTKPSVMSVTLLLAVNCYPILRLCLHHNYLNQKECNQHSTT